MLDKEVKKNPALLALLGSQEESEPKEEKAPKEKKVKKDARKQNPRCYERNRGKGGTKPMSYYLPQDIIDLLNIKAAKERQSKSEIVLEGLRYVLREELKESKKSSAEKEEVI